MKMQIHASFREISWWKVISCSIIFINFFPNKDCHVLGRELHRWNGIFLFFGGSTLFTMFLCLQTLPARLHYLTYGLLRSSGKPCSFLSDTWGLGPWGQSLSPQRSGVTVAGHSFAAAAVLTASRCPPPPRPTLLSHRLMVQTVLPPNRHLEVSVQPLHFHFWVCVDPMECARCTPLMCSTPWPRKCRASQSLCLLDPPQCLSCSDSGFPDLGEHQLGSCKNMCRPSFNSDLLISISKIWLKEFWFLISLFDFRDQPVFIRLSSRCHIVGFFPP